MREYEFKLIDAERLFQEISSPVLVEVPESAAEAVLEVHGCGASYACLALHPSDGFEDHDDLFAFCGYHRSFFDRIRLCYLEHILFDFLDLLW